MRKIIYTRPDGGLSVIHPVPNARLMSRWGQVKFNPPVPAYSIKQFRTAPDGGTLSEILSAAPITWAETEDQFIMRIFEKDVPKNAIDAAVVDATDVPRDRSRRNKWAIRGGKLQVAS